MWTYGLQSFFPSTCACLKLKRNFSNQSSLARPDIMGTGGGDWPLLPLLTEVTQDPRQGYFTMSAVFISCSLSAWIICAVVILFPSNQPFVLLVCLCFALCFQVISLVFTALHCIVLNSLITHIPIIWFPFLLCFADSEGILILLLFSYAILVCKALLCLLCFI